MTIPFRVAMAALLLTAPLAAQAQHAPTAPVAPHAAPASAAADLLPNGGMDAMDDAMWLDEADLMAFGLDDELLGGAMFMGADALELGDFEDGSPDGLMNRNEDEAGESSGHGMHMAPGGPGGMGHPGMGPGAMAPGGGGGHGGMGMHPGMAGGSGMHGKAGRMGMRRGMRGGMGGGMGMRMAQLGLSDAQRDKMRALHEANARKAVLRRADLQLAQMDLRKLLRAEKPEIGAINTQVDRVARLRADGIKAAIDTRLQARAVLTPEQWKSLHQPMRRPGPGGMMKHDGMDGSGPGKQ